MYRETPSSHQRRHPQSKQSFYYDYSENFEKAVDSSEDPIRAPDQVDTGDEAAATISTA